SSVGGVEVRPARERLVQLAVPAFLVALLVASSLPHASATIVTIATDSAVGKNSLAMPGSQDVLKDAFGKYLAVYVDAGGSVSVVYANSDPSQAGAWNPPSKSPIPVAAYRRPAAVITSPLTHADHRRRGTGGCGPRRHSGELESGPHGEHRFDFVR